jgi:hypothetical protein
MAMCHSRAFRYHNQSLEMHRDGLTDALLPSARFQPRMVERAGVGQLADHDYGPKGAELCNLGLAFCRGDRRGD